MDTSKKNIQTPFQSQNKQITDEQIERDEISQNKEDQKTGERNRGVSTTNIDPSKNRKGNVGVTPASISDRESDEIENEANKIEGAGDIGTGRGSGGDRA